MTLVGPGEGRLASGASGVGRMAEPEEILDAARWVLGRQGPLAGRQVVVTAGGTREPLDPIRFLGNRSSGRMGYALARAARDRGAQVTLISTTDQPAPFGAELVTGRDRSRDARCRAGSRCPGRRADHGRRRGRLSAGDRGRQKIKKGDGELVWSWRARPTSWPRWPGAPRRPGDRGLCRRDREPAGKRPATSCSANTWT